ncbi:MAG: RNA polymerase subunit sigma-70, partial [Lachnospiraceae bacterium]|nr:RNA polymerase subunit sigma-70 [Lachnospiraceae bacterium]
MEDNNKTPFKEKLAELLDFARKKKNVLEYQEVNDFFADYELEPDRVEHIYEYLENNGVDVLRAPIESHEEILEEIDDEVMEDDGEEIDLSAIDLTIPEGVSLEDPVRMYLKEIGKVPLLSAEDEIELAKRMEAGNRVREDIEQIRKKNERATAADREKNNAKIKKITTDNAEILARSEEAKKRLSEANLRLVVSIAKRYVG